MKNINKFNSFNEFWPSYLDAHASRASRRCHLAGLALAALTVVALVSVGLLFFLPLAIVPAQLGAKLGHRLSPRVATAVEEAPLWEALADVKMCALMVGGRLDRSSMA